MKHRTRWLAGFSAVLLALMMAATASGYSGQVKGSISIAIRATLTCGGTITATATLLDANGAPIAGQSVAWSLITKQSTSDRINKTPTITNASGVATTTLTLAAVSGTRRIRATVSEGTAGQVSATAALNVTCSGLPNTSTLPAEAPAAPAAPIFAMLLAFVVGGGLTLRRLASARR